MRVYDCFMFNNELDVLELRLRELSPVVDRFVLVEAAETHSGLPKPLHFAANRERFAPWLDRITAIALDRLPESDDAWVKENAQRNAILQGLPEVRDDDLVVVSDVDEIPRAVALAAVARRPDILVAGFRLTHFHMRLNYLQLKGDDPVFVWPVAARGRALKKASPQDLRNYRVTLQLRSRSAKQLRGHTVLRHAGWHFSYMGDDEHVRRKLASFAHRELANSDVLERHGIAGALDRRLDLFGRPGFKWAAVALNDYFPQALTGDPDRYAHLLLSHPEFEIDVAASRSREVIAVKKYRGAAA